MDQLKLWVLTLWPKSQFFTLVLTAKGSADYPCFKEAERLLKLGCIVQNVKASLKQACKSCLGKFEDFDKRGQSTREERLIELTSTTITGRAKIAADTDSGFAARRCGPQRIFGMYFAKWISLGKRCRNRVRKCDGYRKLLRLKPVRNSCEELKRDDRLDSSPGLLVVNSYIRTDTNYI
ncbi:hypothetical protein TNIN_188341 [Trichonephila inaurata madagascariensis]|uniref:Uncharacterized protein n=1 Tax=Trichonephila inaurata madagascariensis TaxID=2747483 RepID=A0A8X7CE11_9ARAC|nr:hypothetical protein TNIN_188341 [Trichonephila inaurata madagascariensis]